MARRRNEIDYGQFIDMKKIPILPLDNRWHQLFDGIEKPSNIKRLEKEVMSLVKREGGVNNELKQLVKVKKKLMNEIMANMQESDSDEKLRQKKLDASQKLIGDINKKTTDLENEKYKLPYRLLQANEELLQASLDICYSRLNSNQEKIEFLTKWIEETRIKLKKNVIVKQELQESSNNIYTYMHDILGPEFMEIFDKTHDIRNGINNGNEDDY